MGPALFITSGCILLCSTMRQACAKIATMHIKTAAEAKRALAGLVDQQMMRLAALSGLSVGTLYKIKRGETKNPGIDTVGKFAPHLRACRGRK